MIQQENRWLLLQLSEGERLYRVRMSNEGFLSLPDIGVVNITKSSKEKYSFQSSQGAIGGDLFEEGEILSRRAPDASPARAPVQRNGKLPMVLALATGVVLLSRFVPAGAAVSPVVKQTTTAISVQQPKPRKASSKPLTTNLEKPSLPKEERVVAEPLAPSAIPTTLPSVFVSPKIAARSPASPKVEKVLLRPQPQKKEIPWSLAEKEARAAFQRGDWAKAEGALSDLPMKKSEGTPDRVRALGSEIQYAKCQRAFNEEKFKAAADACGKATESYRNARAYALLRQLSERARRLYLEGYVMEGTNREAAIRRYREVLESAPLKDPFRAKAAKKLKVIETHS